MRVLIISIIFLAITENLYSQGCSSPHSAVNTNYCCGRDPEYISQSNDHCTYSWGNLCSWHYFEQAYSPPTYASNGSWMLVWKDEFNDYSTLNESFYSPVSQIAYNINDGREAWSPSDPTPNTKPFWYMQDPSLVRINQNGNGKLQLFENYDSDPNKMTQRYSYGNPDLVYMHSDYTVGHIETKFRFPQNCRVQASIKTYPVVPTQWPAFWLYGDNGIELDIFEMPYEFGGSHPWNNQQLVSTMHFREYGLPTNILNQEATVHFTGWTYDLSNSFHKYELTWDNWAVRWFFDDIKYHSINRFYKLYHSWSSKTRKKFYRSQPVNSSADYNNHSDQVFTQNKFFPGFFYTKPDPVMIIFNNQMNPNKSPLGQLNSSFVNSASSMDMDYLHVWVKTVFCGQTRDVTDQNINVCYSGQGAVNDGYDTNNVLHVTSHQHRNYLEAAGTLNFTSGNNVTVEWSQLGLFVATDEISFQDGFGVAEGGNMFAFITLPCESLSDNRDGAADNDSIVDQDSEPYYYPDGTIDSTDLVNQEFGGRFYNQTNSNSNGIIDVPTNASANNKYLNQDILVKTDEAGFTVESMGSKITTIELLDSKASLVLRESDPNITSYKISKAYLAQGLYTCIIYTTVGIEVRKIWVWR